MESPDKDDISVRKGIIRNSRPCSELWVYDHSDLEVFHILHICNVVGDLFGLGCTFYVPLSRIHPGPAMTATI